jgi:gamma-glutamyl:cysteine ligase YbdK (ATP-grasp superfamily)
VSGAHHLFDVTGIELEYMIVESDSLDVLPIADDLIRAECGNIASETFVGEIAWSNELVLHVIELKTNGPVRSLAGLDAEFQKSIDRIGQHLAGFEARLLPSGMHPWLDPQREIELWPHDDRVVYDSFHRIFDCRGHGWSNLQSLHINLPFSGDEEFGRLHAAIRCILPLLPALSASSPYQEGRATGRLDTRLAHYAVNCARVPAVTGDVVPEPVFTRSDYQERILERIYRDLAPLDPQGVLRHEWVNARGCIARFERDAIEIRVLDVSESPRVDLAIADATVAITRALVDERISRSAEQRAVATAPLAELLREVARIGGAAETGDERLLRALGWTRSPFASAAELLRGLFERVRGELAGGAESARSIDFLLARGSLAERLLRAAGPSPSRDDLGTTYRALADCLAQGRVFGAQT